MPRRIVNFACLLLFFLPIKQGYCLNLDKAKAYFLSGDYKSAISEGERILSGSRDSSGIDELYYILALSYLKDGNFLRASDIFEIILNESRESAFKEEARLGLGDTYFFRGDFKNAEINYKMLLDNYPRTKYRAAAYYRLSQAGVKSGDTQSAKEYLAKLKAEFPANTELRFNKDLSLLSDPGLDFHYTVQVGFFASAQNARGLCDKLIQKGYDAYIEEAALKDGKAYRVRVGRLKSRPEASRLENKLSQEGYPTKICP
ncbi:MAG: SPOR domain-containing protein [Candidatus Omnitrophota bacterium]|jgi:tetratricopeptide (TPR) repeat protein